VVTPVPIPNTEVKHFSGKYSYACHSEKSTLPDKKTPFLGVFLYVIINKRGNMDYTFKTQNVEETKKIGYRIGSLCQAGMVITLSGDLGAGKTVLAKGIALGLDIHQTVSSPTFTILKQYIGRLPLNHFDAYRLEGLKQDLGFGDMIGFSAVTVIEWPEYILELLPKERLDITIHRIDENIREFKVKAYGEVYDSIMKEIL
jgi:tRNA threonylcarbamoyladenosine biosynthesis protein TsaE